MRKYIIKKEENIFLVGHKGWFGRWKTDWKFENISGLLDFVVNNWFYIELFTWEFPKPTFQDSDKTPFGRNTISDPIDKYRFLSELAKNKDFNTETADLCFVYDDQDGIYKIVDKPYNSFKESFKSTHCLPCWSHKSFQGYSNAYENWKHIEDEKIRIDTKCFHNSSEYEDWRNKNPNFKILEFKDIHSPWHSFAYEVSYEYKNFDKNE